MDFLRSGGQSGPSRDFTVCIIRFVYRTPMDNDATCAKFASFSIQKVAHPSGIHLQLAAETCEFAQVPSLSMSVHGTLMDLNLTFMN